MKQKLEVEWGYIVRDTGHTCTPHGLCVCKGWVTVQRWWMSGRVDREQK